MQTFISLGLALMIHFYSPGISENKKSIKNNLTQNSRGFPYQSFEGEILTDEMVEVRIRVIYIYIMISITVNFLVDSAVASIVGQIIAASTSTSIERLIPLNFQTNQQRALLNLRRGGYG